MPEYDVNESYEGESLESFDDEMENDYDSPEDEEFSGEDFLNEVQEDVNDDSLEDDEDVSLFDEMIDPPEDESFDDSVSSNDIDVDELANSILMRLNEENFTEETTEEYEVCTDEEVFRESTIQVDLYQYTILKRLEFMQYALCIVIALLFLLIYLRYKK